MEDKQKKLLHLIRTATEPRPDAPPLSLIVVGDNNLISTGDIHLHGCPLTPPAGRPRPESVHD